MAEIFLLELYRMPRAWGPTMKPSFIILNPLLLNMSSSSWLEAAPKTLGSVIARLFSMGIPPMDAAVTLSLIGAANIPGRLVIGKMSDTLDRKALGVACALVQTGTLLWLMWANGLWMLYTFAIVYGFLWGGSGAVITALISDVFGTRSLGAIMGMMSAGWALGAAIGPAVGGYIFDASGSYFTAFATGAAAVLISALLVALIKRRTSNEERGAEDLNSH